ncbi:MAG: signal peptidase I [Ruminococcus sp.]|nr:signal peptidase I [Ruminococcus sp.]
MKETETKTQNKMPSKGSRIIKTVLNTIINILIVMVLVTSILIAVLSLTSKANNGVATIFGYSFHTIQTPSMDGGNPDFDGGDYKVGDLVIGKTDGASDRDYQVGDIISYRTASDEGETMLICHRIVDKTEYNGVAVYQTQGDANDTPDQLVPEDYIHNYDITSLCYDADYHGKVLSGWGKPLDFIREPQGFFFAVLLPMIIFFMYEIIRVVLNAMNYKKSKANEEKENAEKEKQEAVDAAVAAALAAKDSDKSSEAPAGITAEQMEQFKQFMEFQKMQNAAKEADTKPTDTED